VARLNPFNTSSFAWIDIGIARYSLPHLYRSSIVNVNLSNSSVVEEHAVLFNHVMEYEFNETLAYHPTSSDSYAVLIGGSMFAGTPIGFRRRTGCKNILDCLRRRRRTCSWN